MKEQNQKSSKAQYTAAQYSKNEKNSGAKVCMPLFESDEMVAQFDYKKAQCLY